MRFIRSAVGMSVAVLFGTVLPALAAPEDCDAIAAATAAIGTVPAYRQDIEQDGTTMTTIAIGDDLYVMSEGETTRLPVIPGGRAAIAAQIFSVFTVEDCSALPDETIEGRAMKVYRFVIEPDGLLVPGRLEQRIWIGAEDGLPYLVTNPTGKSVVTYDGVEAPAP